MNGTNTSQNQHPYQETWKGVESVPRIFELDNMGFKRAAIAKMFGKTTQTLRDAIKKYRKTHQ